MSSRRLLTLLLVLVVLGIPAGVMSAVCLGRSCDASKVIAVKVPFCPLPAGLRTQIENGYLQGRSPDVFGVTAAPGSVRGMTGAPGAGAAGPWPSISSDTGTQVPIVFQGTGVSRGAKVPDGIGLDDIAPTIAAAIRLKRPHPDVRAGTAVPGLASKERPRLVLEVAWQGIGTQDLQASPKSWPFLRSLMASGAGTTDAQTGSLPIDPAASLATIGTGGLPSQHGITGTLVRNDNGVLTEAYGKGAPVSVVATLADDMEHLWGKSTHVGLVEPSTADGGLVGGGWYVPEPRPTVSTGGAAAATAMLSEGFGSDPKPDLMAVVLHGSISRMDSETARLAAAASKVSHGSTMIVVAGTGSPTGLAKQASSAQEIASQVDSAIGAPGVVQAAVPGGLFLDQSIMAQKGIAGGRFVQALAQVKGADGRTLMAETFPSFSISFARYCH